jgi:4-hydroxybenzoate polyprenyltransferase
MGMLLLALHLGWQAIRVDISRPELSFRLFRANILTGCILLLASLAGVLITSPA